MSGPQTLTVARGARRVLSVVAIVSAAVVAVLAVAVSTHLRVGIDLDASASRHALEVVRDHRVVLRLCRAVTQLGNPLVVNGVCATAAIAALWRRQRVAVVSIIVARLGSAATELVVKLIVDRPRPHPLHPVAHATGPSFPSGHSTGIATVATLAIIGLWLMTPRRSRTGWTAAARGAATGVLSVITAAVATSRVMLGVHYPTDVVAGVAVGVCLACSATLIAIRLPASRLNR